jgi:hypothetical protein
VPKICVLFSKGLAGFSEIFTLNLGVSYMLVHIIVCKIFSCGGGGGYMGQK